MNGSLRFLPLSLLALAPLLAAGCGSSGPSGPVGGAVTGAVDDHCFMNDALTKAKVGMCMVPTASDGGASADAGAPEPPGPPLFNSDGYDDDCKYHVSWTSTPIRKDANVTFTLMLEGLDPPGPVHDATIDVEGLLGDTHVLPNTGTTTSERPANSGTYEIGPVKFNASGEWTFRFHFFENCSDEFADSPHGHIAFRINVP
jgi:hypothetical protein